MSTSDSPIAASTHPTSAEKLVKTASYYLSFVIIGMCAAILGPTLPGLAEQTDSALEDMSLLFIASGFGYMTGSFIGGRLFDSVRGHPIMGTMLLAIALLAALVPFFRVLSLLMVLILFFSMMKGSIDVGGNTLLVWVHREKVGPFMNGLHFCFGLGAFIAPIIVAQVLLKTDGISLAYWLLGLIVIPVAFCFFFVPSPTLEKLESSREQSIANPVLTVGIVLFFFLYVGVEVGFAGWLYSYALKTDLADKAGAAYLVSGFWGAFTLGRLFSIPLSLRIRPVYMLFGSLLGGMVSVGLIILYPEFYPALLIGAIGLGAFMASVFPTALSFSERRMQISGRVTSWFLIGSSIGAMTFSWIIGQTMAFNPLNMMLILLGLIMAAILLLCWICFWLRPPIIARTG